MISPRTSHAAFNNQYASAAAEGDPRYQMKTLDRGGLSRGAGQVNQAGMQGAMKMADGIASAYSGKTANQQYNAGQAQQAQQANDVYSQSMAALQQQQQYSAALAKLQQTNSSLNFASSLLGGLLD